MELYLNKYRKESNRKPQWNYMNQARYFVTICTKGRVDWFGEVNNGIMGLNERGCIVVNEIEKTNSIRNDVTIDDWVVMPDHIHLIICISYNDFIDRVETHRRCVSTDIKSIISLWCRRSGTLGSIIAQLKPAVTKRIRQTHLEFQWQTNYYDHIIRNEREYQKIKRYIHNNPQRFWNRDNWPPW